MLHQVIIFIVSFMIRLTARQWQQRHCHGGQIPRHVSHHHHSLTIHRSCNVNLVQSVFGTPYVFLFQVPDVILRYSLTLLRRGLLMLEMSG